jgi:hypothetical protein
VRIFIDETGSFVVPPGGGTSFCGIGGLVIPDASYDLFSREFLKISRRWPKKDGEIKGSLLQADHILTLAKLANRLGLIYFFSGADMSFIKDTDTAAHRGEQAKALLSTLTPEHNPNLIRQVHEVSEKLNRMPPQLYVQFVLLTELVSTIIRTMSVYYSITWPRELGSFSWTIDAKDRGKTEAERLWELLGGLIIQSKFQQSPPYAIKGSDNSDFEAAYLNEDQNWPDYIPRPQSSPSSVGGHVINLKKLMCKSLSFTDSKSSLGLQAVDVITNAMRRTFHGEFSLQFSNELGKLLVTIPMGSFSPVVHMSAEMDGEPIDAPYAEILRRFKQAAERKFAAALREFYRS